MIRVGIVGCGRILNAHLHGFRQLREKGIDCFRISALVSRSEEEARRFHTRGRGPAPLPPVLPPESSDPLAAPHTYVSDFQDAADVRVYADYRRMIADGAADAVLDTTPVFLHHQIGLTALDAGMHLLTQKPLGVTVRAGQAMVQRAHERGLCLGVFENARYRPLIRAARWAFVSGLLGQPQLAILGAVGGPWSPDRVVADTAWRHDKLLAGGGASIDIGVHHMHMLRYVLGEVESVQALVRTLEPERVVRDLQGQISERVRPDVDDTYFASVSCAGGAVGQLLLSWAGRGAPLPLPGVPAFYGSRGCIQGGQLFLDDGSRHDLLERFGREIDPDSQEIFFPLGLRDPFAVLQLQWLRGIESGNGRDLETTGAEGLRDLAAAYAILESSLLGRRVTLEEVLCGAADSYQQPIDEHHGLRPSCKKMGKSG